MSEKGKKELKGGMSKGRLGCFGLIFLFLVVLAIGSLPPTSDSPRVTKLDPSQSPYENKRVIEALIREEIGAGRVKSITADWLTTDVYGHETSIHAKRAWNVHVEYKWFAGSLMSTKDHMDLKMMGVCRHLYTSGLPIRVVSVDAYLDLIDPYGNTFETLVYSLTMDHRMGAKVNWENHLQIIGNPGYGRRLFQVRFMHHVLRE